MSEHRFPILNILGKQFQFFRSHCEIFFQCAQAASDYWLLFSDFFYYIYIKRNNKCLINNCSLFPLPLRYSSYYPFFFFPVTNLDILLCFCFLWILKTTWYMLGFFLRVSRHKKQKSDLFKLGLFFPPGWCQPVIQITNFAALIYVSSIASLQERGICSPVNMHFTWYLFLWERKNEKSDYFMTSVLNQCAICSK